MPEGRLVGTKTVKMNEKSLPDEAWTKRDPVFRPCPKTGMRCGEKSSAGSADTGLFLPGGC